MGKHGYPLGKHGGSMGKHGYPLGKHGLSPRISDEKALICFGKIHHWDTETRLNIFYIRQISIILQVLTSSFVVRNSLTWPCLSPMSVLSRSCLSPVFLLSLSCLSPVFLLYWIDTEPLLALYWFDDSPVSACSFSDLVHDWNLASSIVLYCAYCG